VEGTGADPVLLLLLLLMFGMPGLVLKLGALLSRVGLLLLPLLAARGGDCGLLLLLPW
jgi:hypothetical protein